MNESSFGEEAFYGHTTLHPAGLAATILMGGLLLLIPRKYAVLPLLAMACFVAPAQRIVVFGLDFTLLRVMVLLGWVRALAWQECRAFRWHLLDFLMIACAASETVIYTIQSGTVAALINRLGASFDALAMYFLFRVLVRSWEDVCTLLRGLVCLSLPVLAAFLIEKHTGRNLFAFLGGVPYFTAVREGRLRCQGAFAHAILAGTFWAAWVPPIAALWWRGGINRWYSSVGCAACVLLIFLCSSSTPVAALLFAALAGSMWPVRHWMRWVRWGLAGVLTLLHLVMEAPVWHLVARIDLVGGSTGWHRYKLIDEFIRRFDEWALLGTPSTEHWDIWGLSDITNQYVLQGVRGGLLTLALFVGIIVVAFREVGLLWRSVQQSAWQVALAWSFGVALFVHITAFLAVSYFGQIIMVWYLLLAIIVNSRMANRENQR